MLLSGKRGAELNSIPKSMTGLYVIIFLEDKIAYMNNTSIFKIGLIK